MEKVLGFQYRFTDGVSKHSEMHQTNSGNYAEAMDQLLTHVLKKFNGGGEIEIEKIIIFKIVKR
jgi:hypothetical protein